MPGLRCAVSTCKNDAFNTRKKSLDISFHRFPSDIKLRKAWIINCKRKNKFNVNTAAICSEHFLKEDFKTNLQNELMGIPPKKALKKDVIPSVKLDSACNRNNNKNVQSILTSINQTSENNLIVSEDAIKIEQEDLENHTEIMFKQSNVEKTMGKSNAKPQNENNIAEGNKSNICCIVPECESKSSDTAIEYFELPESKHNRLKWFEFCGLHPADLKSNTGYICSTHFDETAYITEIKQIGSLTYLIRVLHPDAFPTLNPPNIEQNSLKLIITESEKQTEQIKDLVMKQEIDELNPQKYGHIRTKDDLLKLKIINKTLLKQIETYKLNEIKNKRILQKQEQVLAKLKTQLSDKKVLSKDVLAKVFSPSQVKLLSGCKKTAWTVDDLAVGLTIKYLSNRRFYSYLTGTLNYPFPGFSSIQRYITAVRNRKGSRSKKQLDINQE